MKIAETKLFVCIDLLYCFNQEIAMTTLHDHLFQHLKFTCFLKCPKITPWPQIQCSCTTKLYCRAYLWFMILLSASHCGSGAFCGHAYNCEITCIFVKVLAYSIDPGVRDKAIFLCVYWSCINSKLCDLWADRCKTMSEGQMKRTERLMSNEIWQREREIRRININCKTT